MKNNHSKVAVITGAGGGIGSEYAKQLAALGYNLILCDRDVKRLGELSVVIQLSYKVQVDTIKVNLASRNSVMMLATDLSVRKRIDLLVNAAGYGEHSLFVNEHIQDSLDMVSVQVLSTIQLVHAVLPGMLRRGDGGIITVSSLAAFIPAPGSTMYSGSKAFLNAFMESLYMEVHNKGVQVQSLCPGLTHTGFHTEADINRFKKIKELDLWMEADDVVRSSIQHLGKGSVVHVPGWLNKTIRHTAPALPRVSYYKLAEKMAKVKDTDTVTS